MKNLNYLGFLLVLVLSPIFSSCSDDDDDNNNGPSGGGGGSERTEYINFAFDGDTYSANTLTVAASDGELDITGSNDNMEVLFECLTSINEGTHTTGSTLGVAVVFGVEGWFSGESCTVVIEEHDTADKYIRGTASGTMTNLFGDDPKPLNSMEFAVSY